MIHSSDVLYPQRLEKELRQIRVLSIQTEEKDGLVSCSLRTVSLNHEVVYVALSYVWGDPETTKPMFVNGILFKATINLELALQSLRAESAKRELWVDAICINQNDVEERNQQVLLMGELYSRASSVLIWLGEGDPAIDMLVEALTRAPVPESDGEGSLDPLGIRELEIRKRAAMFTAIAKRPWWKRVWVVQECVLPLEDPVFRCGHHIITWSQFFLFFVECYRQAEELSSTKHEHSRELLEWRQLLKTAPNGEHDSEGVKDLTTLSVLATVRDDFRKSRRASLPEIVALTFDRKASVAHDYIYGFLGLASDHDRSCVKVDYGESHWELYRSYTEDLLASEDQDGTKIFSMLSFSKPDDGNPSWIPDFSSQSMVGPYGGFLLIMDDCWQFPPDPWFSDNNDVLMLAGVLLGEVSKVLAIPSVQTGLLIKISELEKLARAVVQGSKSHHPGMPYVDWVPSLRRVFTGNNGGRGPLLSDQEKLDECWEVLMDQNQSSDYNHLADAGQARRDEFEGSSTRTVCSQLSASALLTSAGRSLIITRSGHVGISVPHAQPGNILVYLYGFYTPLLLRPAKDHYNVVGAARVGGLEDVLALSQHCSRQQVPEATFRVR